MTTVNGTCTTTGCIVYDAENRQTSYGASGASYTYDGNGRRVTSSIKGVSTVFVYDVAGNLAAKYSSTSTSSTEPCTTCYTSWDHLGSTRMVTDQSGNLISRHDYMPFGEEIVAGDAGRPATIGGSPSPWNTADAIVQKFTDKERDPESGLDYFGARYYGAALGRFTSPDQFKGGFDNLDGQPAFSPGPIGYADLSDPQTLNMYVYTRNNPLRFIDPDGHDFLDYIAGVGNAYGSDNLAGAGRVGAGNDDYKLGQTVGDVAATVSGTVESLIGAGGEVGGTLLDLTGVGALVGVPTQVVSAGAIAHGASTASAGAVQLFKAGGRFSSGTKQEAKEAAGGKCQNCGAETTPGQKSAKGVTPPSNEGQTDHIVPKSKGGSNAPSNAQHLCRECNIEKSDKLPDQQ